MQKLYQLVKNVLVGGGQSEESRTSSRQKYAARLVCRTRHGRFPGKLIDVTPDGMRIKTLARLRQGQLISVSVRPHAGLDGRQRLRCRVAWALPLRTCIEAGLIYEDSPQNLALSWVQMALHQLSPEPGQRRTRRLPMRLPVTLEDDEGEAGPAVCLNLGSGGARVESRFPLPVGSPVRLGLDSSFWIKAKVVGQDGEQMRLRFLPGENRDQKGLKSMLLGLLDEL